MEIALLLALLVFAISIWRDNRPSPRTGVDETTPRVKHQHTNRGTGNWLIERKDGTKTIATGLFDFVPGDKVSKV